MKLVVGITGSIGTGKSTVAKLFKEKGFPVIDTDVLTHDCYEKKGKVTDEVAALFGSDILDDKGLVDRKKLGKLVFGSEESLAKLNSIIHPIVKEKTIEAINQYEGLIFVEVPLLFETDFIKLCDYSIVVYADLDSQIHRIMARDNIDFPTALKRIYSQMPLAKKMELADFIIDNSHSEADLPWQVSQLTLKLEGMVK